jgi:hypothetical protein
MSQPFFRNIVWDDIYHKRVQPPFLPTIKNATDTSNFDSEFTSVTPVLTPVQSGRSSVFFTDLMQCFLLTSSQYCLKRCKRSSVGFLTPRISTRRALDLTGVCLRLG